MLPDMEPELMLPDVEPELMLPDVPLVPDVELSVVPGVGAAGVVPPTPVPGAPEVPGGVAAPVAEESGTAVVVPGEVVGLAFAS